jgi:hypothetical protein
MLGDAIVGFGAMEGCVITIVDCMLAGCCPVFMTLVTENKFGLYAMYLFFTYITYL